MIKRKYKASLLCVLFCWSCFVQTGCFGAFTLTRKVYGYNGGMGNKVFDTGAMYLFLYVYLFSLIIDTTIYNVIEFWAGENPLTMAAMQQQTKEVALNGRSFKVTVSQNCYHIEEAGNTSIIDFVYAPGTRRWNLFKNGMQVN